MIKNNRKEKVVEKIFDVLKTKNGSHIIKDFSKFNSENYIRSEEDGIANTITAKGALSRQKIMTDINTAKPDLLIVKWNDKLWNVRILTEEECLKLMGFNSYDKISHFPRLRKYHVAGNSIVVPVLEAIFEELLGGNANE